MFRAQLAIEIYRYFRQWMPFRIRKALKNYIDQDHAEWRKLGKRDRLLNQTPYYLSLDLAHWHQRWTYVKGYYPDEHLTCLMRKSLQADSIFIDIGANIGVHSLFAASRIGRPSQIWAVEPNPHSFARLMEHVESNRL